MSKVFEERVTRIFYSIKNERINRPLPFKIPIYNDEKKIIAFLRSITKSSIDYEKEIKLLAKWRKENAFAFPTQFKVTFEGTKKWLKGLIENPTRILFFVESNEKQPVLIGHMGLYSFNFQDDSCEVDNIVRGVREKLKGVMTLGLKTLIKWTIKELKPKNIFLRVFSDNERAIKFYKRCKFQEKELIPLEKKEKGDIIFWEENRKLKKAKKYFLKMVYNN